MFRGLRLRPALIADQFTVAASASGGPRQRSGGAAKLTYRQLPPAERACVGVPAGQTERLATSLTGSPPPQSPVRRCHSPSF
ncbi:hypothetical protein SKAU_G00202260 [Synaphobranchus kaupii]|uniref:Uncharacterized protein n=1 Tax=Synaphobranchus kaupii TaxID=118154 RepID=A0A9Q1FFP3_SYNKA|nr:hypothetical protein SKAU_G00202260 [Synaphobranchus kaupii]